MLGYSGPETSAWQIKVPKVKLNVLTFWDFFASTDLFLFNFL
jgi:hypothetical protein